MGTLRNKYRENGDLENKWGPYGDPKFEKGPHGDPGPQMGTHVGAVHRGEMGSYSKVEPIQRGSG